MRSPGNTKEGKKYALLALERAKQSCSIPLSATN